MISGKDLRDVMYLVDVGEESLIVCDQFELLQGELPHGVLVGDRENFRRQVGRLFPRFRFVPLMIACLQHTLLEV